MGIGSERAFRQALAAVLTESFGVEVLNINEYDDAGEVFGRPDQIEFDIIVRNGTLIIFELKSSTDRSQLYIFSRKIVFCEKRHQRRQTAKSWSLLLFILVPKNLHRNWKLKPMVIPPM